MIIRSFLSPFGVDLFCLGKKFLVLNLVGKNLKTKYGRSFFGIFWTLISPISMSLVYYCVFKLVLKVPQPHFLAFILSGVLPWSFFSQTLVEGADALIGNFGLLSKIPIPLPVFPFAGSLTNLVTLFLSIPVLIGVMILTDTPVGVPFLLVPFFYVSLFLITYFVSYAISVFSIFFRDLKHIIGILLQIWFYATPILYKDSMVPVGFKWVLNVNPVAQIFIAIHQIVAENSWPSLHSCVVTWAWVTMSLLTIVLLHKYSFKEVIERM